jgi:chorismate mutase
MSTVAVEEMTNLARLEPIWRAIQQRLEAEKTRIVEEIGDYPAPIPACDAQFNGLLEERAAILQEIGDVKEALKGALSMRKQLALLHNTMLASRYLNAALKEQIRQALSAG